MTVQLADLKNSVRVDVDTDDNLLQGYIKAYFTVDKAINSLV
ncbi:head-tail connector protein, partial [Oenococcus oeni]